MMTKIQEKFLKSLMNDMNYTSLSRNEKGVTLYSKEDFVTLSNTASTFKLLEGVNIPNKKTTIKTIVKNNKG